MIQDTHAQWVLADEGYASTANRAAIQGKHRHGILRKAVQHVDLKAPLSHRTRVWSWQKPVRPGQSAVSSSAKTHTQRA